MSAQQAPLTFNQAVRAITEFIEVAIHTILYVRHVYPPELFVRRKKYDTPVFQSRHPALNEYITGATKAVRDELVHGNVDKVIVVIKSSTADIAYERFVFSIKNMIEIEPYNKDTGVENAMSAPILGQYFRSFLTKLCMIEAQLGHLELQDDITFAIVLELVDNKEPSKSARSKEPPPWVAATTQHTTAGASDEAELHMIRAVDTGIINLSLVVQESGEKLRMSRGSQEPTDKKGKGRAR